jgi:hypothetical protein
VAVGVLGIALIAGVIYYFKNGGTVKGLAKKFEENKDTIKKVTGSVADLLPLTEEQKKKIDSAIDSPISAIPVEVVQIAEKAEQYKTQVIESLPLSPEQKAKINASVESLQKDLLKRIESTPIGSEIKSVIEIVSPSTVVAAAPVAASVVAAAPSTVVAAAVAAAPSTAVAAAPSTVVAAAPPSTAVEPAAAVTAVAAAPSPVVEAPPTVIAAAPISAAAAEPQAEPPAEPALVAVQINAEDLESVRAFLHSKKA